MMLGGKVREATLAAYLLGLAAIQGCTTGGRVSLIVPPSATPFPWRYASATPLIVQSPRPTRTTPPTSPAAAFTPPHSMDQSVQTHRPTAQDLEDLPGLWE